MGAGRLSLGRHRRWRITAGAAVCALLAMLLQAGGVTSGAAAASRVAAAGLAGPQVFGGQVNAPEGVSSDGTHVWVTNEGGNSVTGFPSSG